MRELATKTDDRDEWALAGLLHDIDIAMTAGDLSQHGTVGARILRELGFDDVVAYAVSAHDDHTRIERRSRLDHALYCADQVYWLIVGTGIAFPSDRLMSAKPRPIWQEVQSMHAKARVGKVSYECAQTGLTMAQVFAAAITGMANAAQRIRTQ